MSKISQQLNWFRLSDYDYLDGLSLLGWRAVIRSTLVLDRYLQARELDPDYYLERGTKIRLERRRQAIGAEHQVIDGVFRSYSAPISRYETGTSFLNVDHFKDPDLFLVKVDLEFPDKILIEAFTQWLSSVRQESPSPVKRAGKPPRIPNARITDKHVNKWIRKRIVPLADLHFFITMNDLRVSDAKLAGWLFPDLRNEADPGKIIGESKKELANAKRIARSLAKQVSYENPPPQEFSLELLGNYVTELRLLSENQDDK